MYVTVFEISDFIDFKSNCSITQLKVLCAENAEGVINDLQKR